MKRFILNLVGMAAALLLAAEIIEGVSIDQPQDAAIAALILSIANATLRPLLTLLTLPLKWCTFGLFALVINTLIFWGVSWVVDGFDVSGPIPALLGAILVSGLSMVVNVWLQPKKN